MAVAPVDSPGRLDDPFSIAFSNYLQFLLVPPAKLPKVAFSNNLQFPLVPPAKLPTKVHLKVPVNFPPRNIRHWDQNSIFSEFCHNEYLFVSRLTIFLFSQSSTFGFPLSRQGGRVDPDARGIVDQIGRDMTLGPNFYIFSVLSPRICFCFVNPYFLAGIAASVEIWLLAVSKHVLKRS